MHQPPNLTMRQPVEQALPIMDSNTLDASHRAQHELPRRLHVSRQQMQQRVQLYRSRHPRASSAQGFLSTWGTAAAAGPAAARAGTRQHPPHAGRDPAGAAAAAAPGLCKLQHTEGPQ